jgi:hypothetical protein
MKLAIRSKVESVLYGLVVVGFALLAFGAVNDRLIFAVIGFNMVMPYLAYRCYQALDDQDRAREEFEKWYASASVDAKIDYHLDRARRGYHGEAEIAQALAQNELRKRK